MLQDKTIRYQINTFLISLLKHFPEIKEYKINKINKTESIGFENSFPPIYVDRFLYEGETSVFSLEEI